MSFLSGWLLDAESNTFQVVESLLDYKEILRTLKCKDATCEKFLVNEGMFCVWFNNDLLAQSLYNEAAQSILGRIQFPWKTFHGNFLVTYMVKLNLDEDSKIPHRMPDISISQFVDACNQTTK